MVRGFVPLARFSKCFHTINNKDFKSLTYIVRMDFKSWREDKTLRKLSRALFLARQEKILPVDTKLIKILMGMYYEYSSA